MTTNLYLQFIRNTLKAEGIKVADTANKMALHESAITLDQYQKAAQILAAAYVENTSAEEFASMTQKGFVWATT